MKIIYKIHPIYVIVAFICFITGLFRFFITISIIIIIHEIGHILGMIYYKWNIKKIILLPFGGVIITEELLNKSLNEELIITLLGPLFQIIFTLLINNSYLSMISYPLLIFNLMPIIPLDGSKIINNILNRIFSIQKSYIISMYISTLLIVISLLLYKNLVLLIIYLFLIKETIKYYQNKNYIFNKFLYERYFYDFKFNKRKIIKDISKMKKDYYHLFLSDSNYYTEKEILKELFQNT